MAEKKTHIPSPVVKVQHIVKPAEPTPNHDMYLTGFDQIQATTHTPTIYFYRPTPTTLSEAAQKLKESLSKVLVVFYPIAGRIRVVEKGRVELCCNGEGALLVEAQSEATLEHYGSFMPTPEVRQLIPTVDIMTTETLTEAPLLLCQVTKFKCGGISVGMGICHTLGDGQSCLHFIAEWSKICRGESETVTSMPYLDRGILEKVETLAEQKFHHPEFYQAPLLIGKSDNIEERKKPTTLRKFKITKEQVEKLKNRANENRTVDDARGFSRYEALSGHIWRTASKARGLPDEQLSRVEVAADVRKRLKTKLPEKYYGNTIIRLWAFSKVGDLLDKPLSYAASKLRERTHNVTDEYVKSVLAVIKNAPDVLKLRNFHTAGCLMGAFNGNPNLCCTSWITLPMFGTDWGWGKEIHVGPGILAADGKVFLLPAAEGDGSLNVCIRLQVEHMEAFQKYFYEDM